jgi:hypothetical protein
MPKAAQRGVAGGETGGERSEPAVLRFSARLDPHPDAARAGSAALLRIPAGPAAKLRGMEKVEGVIGGQPFRAALDSDDAGALTLKVNAAMRRGSGADVGDTVELAVLGPEPEPSLAADVRAAFDAAPKAAALWGRLTQLNRLDWVRWIEAAKGENTRSRRISRMIDQLAEGKRRACCVNVYEYMLRRVNDG